MLNLYLRNITSSGFVYFRHDYYKAEPINYALRFSDVQNIQAPAGSFTQAMSLPLTASLQERLGFIDKPGYIPSNDENGESGTTLFKKKYPAALGTNGNPVILGYIQVKSVVTTGPRKDVEVVFFSDGINMTKAVGDKMLTDLDLSDYEHELNLVNISLSWTGALFSGDVRYGLIDKGFNWSLPDNPPWTSDDGLWQGELTPYIRARCLVDQIFEDAGLTYVSDFFDSTDFGNIYLPAYNGNASINVLDEGDQTSGAGLDGDTTGTTALNVLQLVDSISGGSDPSSNWTNATTYKYTCPYTGYYDMTFSCKWETTDPAHFVKIYLYKNGSSIGTLVDTTQTSATFAGFPAFQNSGQLVWDGTLLQSASNGGALDNKYVLGQGFLFEAGDEIQIYRQTNGISAKIYGGGTGTPTVGDAFTTSLVFSNVGAPLSGQDVDLSTNMPELKQVDFLLSLQKMFNLVFIPSGIENEFIVEPWDDYFDTGTQIDWSSKVIRNKSITLRPTTDIQFKEYEWTYREGLDFISDAVENNLNRVYGAFKVLDSENDFATGDKKLETNVGNYILSLIPGSSFPIHRSLQTDGSGIENPLAMLAYWGGLVTSFGEYYLRNDVGTTVGPSTLFPLFSPYSANNPTLTDRDLNFGMEAAFVPQQCNPLNTLYYTYWKDYIRELYAESSRILECTVIFDNFDLLQFNWNNKYYIDDALWRVLELNTDLNGNGTATVKLLKVQDASVDCEDTPTSYLPLSNTILFNNSTLASPDYGSKECCIKYGYRYELNRNTGNRCRPRNQQTQPQ
ncbi:MAG: hypothetical protein CL581_20590 [Alteromonadaceae bacterium]|nr:hypothetical protein [Alteromonadaceae bacterium]